MYAPREVIGAYRVQHFLGAGNAASVFYAENGQQKVAIKIRERTSGKHEAFLYTRFREGARLQWLFAHPHIVWLHDYFEDPLIQATILEYLPGGSLQTLLKDRGQLSQAEVCALGIRIADALDHIHDVGVIHRDIKPENLLFADRTDLNSIKLADFDVSKDPRFSPNITESGAHVGTLWYISPEQFDQSEPMVSSDIYSLGLVLYEAKAGRLPFEPLNKSSIFRRFLDHAPLAPLQDISSDASPGLAWILERSVAIEPNERVPSAATFATLLFALVPDQLEQYGRAKLLLRRSYKEWIRTALSTAPVDVQKDFSLGLPSILEPTWR